MTKISVGLVRGRHEMPVEGYIFENVENVLDFAFLREGAEKFVAGIPADAGLELYVTGLTAATAEVIRACAVAGVALTLRHFDRETGLYVPQKIF